MVRTGYLAFALALLVAAAPQEPPTQAQQRSVFRGGTRFVRVDAYPFDKSGRILEGLKAGDFEILEDGKPQTIDTLDFIRFDTFTPETERRNPSSQREGFEFAADPRYRVFVIFVDMGFTSGFGVYSTINDIGRVRQPLVKFIDRLIGVHDLYGLLSSSNTVSELVLGQKTAVTEEQVQDGGWRAAVERLAEPPAAGRCARSRSAGVPVGIARRAASGRRVRVRAPRADEGRMAGPRFRARSARGSSSGPFGQTASRRAAAVGGFSENDDRPRHAAFGPPRGDYLFELTVGAGAVTERHLLAVRMKP